MATPEASSVSSSPVGARWIRAALQVNPFDYQGHPAPSDSYTSEADYNKALLDECESLGISLLAITDHWCATSAAGLIKAAKARGIVALPGFEANSSEGIHLLVVFEAGTKIDDVTMAIGACTPPAGDPHGVSKKGFVEIVEDMTQLGALVIPAHVNIATSGLLHRATGKPLEPMIKHEGIHALGITPSAKPMGQQAQILANAKPFERQYPLVEIHADDVSSPAALGAPGATTWFKMSEPGLAGLAHALRIPQTRVSLTDPSSKSRVLLREMSWVGGFLDGQMLPIAEDLTALIGGRGTGKSTVIESLRYVLGIEPIGEDATRDHQGVINKVVRTATTISLTVDVVSPMPGRYVVERTVPNPPVVRDASGTITTQRPSDIVGSLDVFGQHELAELAQDKTMMARLVMRVAGEPIAHLDRAPILQDLLDNREALAKLERDQTKLEKELEDIPRLKEQAKKFSDSDLGTKLQERTTLTAEDGIFIEVGARLDEVEEDLRNVDLAAVAEGLRAPIDGIDGSPREGELKPARVAAEAVAAALDEAQKAIDAAFAEARTKVGAAKTAWDAKVKPIQDTNEEVFRQLIADGYEPDAYVQTQAQLDKLTKRAEQRKVLAARMKSLLAAREELMQKLADNDTAIAKELNKAITLANSATVKMVVVKPIADPDRSRLRAIVDRHFKTPRTQIMAAIDEENFSTRAFVEAARKGDKALAPYGVVGAQAANLIALGEPLFRELEEVSVGTAVDVQLNVAPKGKPVELRKLEELSKGQRATALLLLLLGASTSPLIIDQPEDDLDNRFVYDGVVPHLRKLKGTRQLVVSTHNANIPVLGDAELVITLVGDGSHGWPAADGIGSLDTKTVRSHAENLLEGGPDAFHARWHLYGF